MNSGVISDQREVTNPQIMRLGGGYHKTSIPLFERDGQAQKETPEASQSVQMKKKCADQPTTCKIPGKTERKNCQEITNHPSENNKLMEAFWQDP